MERMVIVAEKQIIYGDGMHSAWVFGDEVVLRDGDGYEVVFSRAAFREVLIGYERHQHQEYDELVLRMKE
jgi:hypothetical protein